MKRFLSLLLVLGMTVSLSACGSSEMVDPAEGTADQAMMAPTESDLGPLTVADCQEIGQLVDAETGYSCLVGVAIEQEDPSICGQIPQSSSQYQECLDAMAK